MYLAQKSRRYYVPGEKKSEQYTDNPNNTCRRERKKSRETWRDKREREDKYEINVSLVSFFALKKRGDEGREKRNNGISGEET